MNRLKLVLPTLKYKENIMAYKAEFIKNNDSMDGTAALKDAKTFEQWYKQFCDNLKSETVREGLVPSTTYMATSAHDNRLIGMVDIRHRLNDHLLNFGGHIGFSIRKTERQKGYATELLSLALKECANLNIEKVLITCEKNNLASAKTILNNGAKLENEILMGSKVIQRYWIALD